MNPAALGRYLRESRETKELTLEEAVVALRIRRNVLESFERGEFDLGDSPVRVRGMLRNYARYLGLEEDRVLQYYEAAHDKRRKGRFFQRETHVEPVAPKKITDTPPTLPAVVIPTPSRIGGILRNLAMILVSIAALVVIGYVGLNMLEFEEVIETPMPTEGTVTITPTNTPSLEPRATVPTQTPDRLALGLVNIQVILQMEQRSWVRVRVDGQDVYTGILEPNIVQTYEGSNLIEIVAANAAALRITYNGVEQQAYGQQRQQVELKFSPNGVESSLGTASAVPSETSPEASEEAFVPSESASVEEVQLVITPTAIVAGLPSPTPLFPLGNASPTAATNAQASADTSNSTQSQSTTNTSSGTVPTATVPVPSLTPTTAAVLPLRETPADATPTKQG
jgi:hypothetical protein